MMIDLRRWTDWMTGLVLAVLINWLIGSFYFDLKGVISGDHDLFDQLLMTEWMTVSVRCQAHIHRVDILLILRVLQDCFAQVADAADGLRKDDSVELQAEVFGGLLWGLSSLAKFGSRLDHSLVCHIALFVKTVHKRSWCNDLSLRAFFACLALVVHRADVV